MIVRIRSLATSIGAALMACVACVGDAHAQEKISSITQISYDELGRIKCTAVRMDPAQWDSQTDACVPQLNGPNGPDRITQNVYDAAGQLVQIRKAVGVPGVEQADVTYTYTPNGKQEYVVDANGNKARLVYDGFDRQVQWQFPSVAVPPQGFNGATPATALTTAGNEDSGNREEYRYDANGNRTRLTKRDGSIIEYQYDALNRLVHKKVPNPSGGPVASATANCHASTSLSVASDGNDVCYDYDLRGLQTKVRFGWESGPGVGNAYDALGRLVSATTNMPGASRTLGYLYDASGNRKRMTHPDGTYFTYDYDALNRLQAIRQDGGAAVVSTIRDVEGREEAETRGGVVTTYRYDGASRLKSLKDELAGTAGDILTTFGDDIQDGYNPANQIIRLKRSNDAYRVDSRTNAERRYDPANGLNQYSVARTPGYDPTNFGYDGNGNLITHADTHYKYDAENRLLSSSRGAGLVYDPMGRLSETSFNSAEVTRFVYDGDQLALEYDAAGNVLRRYVHGTGEDDPLLWYEGAGLTDRLSLQADHQGSIVSVADASGNVIGINSYDEYGVGAKSNIGRFQYTGQAWLRELGMFYYKARIYSPTLGRFLQTDPIGYDDQINLYAYVGNDPVNGRDPDGLCEKSNNSTECRRKNAANVEAARVEPQPQKKGFLAGAATGASEASSMDFSLPQFDTPGKIGYVIGHVTSGVGQLVAGAFTEMTGIGGVKKGIHVYRASVSTARDVWSSVARSLPEQIALNSAKRGGGGTRIVEALGDMRFRGLEKWQTVQRLANGNKVVVHYVRHPVTGRIYDAKVTTVVK